MQTEQDVDCRKCGRERIVLRYILPHTNALIEHAICPHCDPDALSAYRHLQAQYGQEFRPALLADDTEITLPVETQEPAPPMEDGAGSHVAALFWLVCLLLACGCLMAGAIAPGWVIQAASGALAVSLALIVAGAFRGWWR